MNDAIDYMLDYGLEHVGYYSPRKMEQVIAEAEGMDPTQVGQKVIDRIRSICEMALDAEEAESILQNRPYEEEEDEDE